jgi:hypothetical protein
MGMSGLSHSKIIWQFSNSYSNFQISPVQWSVHTATLTDQPRTNNRVEGWHLKFNKFLTVSHLEFYKFLFNLKEFFLKEEDRRRKSRADHLVCVTAAAALGVALAPPSFNFLIRRLDELNIKIGYVLAIKMEITLWRPFVLV